MSTVADKWWGARHPPADPTHLSFKNKTVLVTGANSGLGFEAAVKYAKLGASTLILAVRSHEKGEAAKTSILNRTKCSADIVVMTVDLASFASVGEFVQRLNERVTQLHIVQLAAGVLLPSYTSSEHAYEMSLQVNVLSTALMAVLLLPKVRETAAASNDGDLPHICILNSLATEECEGKWIPEGQNLIQRINDASQFNHVTQYYLVKLAARLFMQELAAHYCDDGAGHKIIINACCPGYCKTNLLRNYPWLVRALMVPYQFVVARTAEQGSRTLVSATGLGPESNGKLWLHDELPP